MSIKFVSDAEYKVILDRVNQVICEFSKSSDKSGDAAIFLNKISQKCTTREEFLKVVEQRLDLISNPNAAQESLEWFKLKRGSLVGLLNNIKEKLSKDPSYINRHSSSFAKGIQCLDRLLKVDANQINSSHFLDISRVKKMVLELKEEAGSKTQAKVPTDPCFLYSTLHDVINLINLQTLISDDSAQSSANDSGNERLSG